MKMRFQTANRILVIVCAGCLYALMGRQLLPPDAGPLTFFWGAFLVGVTAAAVLDFIQGGRK